MIVEDAGVDALNVLEVLRLEVGIVVLALEVVDQNPLALNLLDQLGIHNGIVVFVAASRQAHSHKHCAHQCAEARHAHK
jgi:hypothetical protein